MSAVNSVGQWRSEIAKTPLAFRPALHTPEQVVAALVPYYGPNRRVSAIFVDHSSCETRVEATLNTLVAALRQYLPSVVPLLVIE